MFSTSNGRGRRARPIHEKSMSSYGLFAWRDALSVANYIVMLFEASEARRAFSSFNELEVMQCEADNRELIRDFINKTESQRDSFFRRITKDANDESKILFLVLVIIGLLRSKATIDVRDRFCTALAPGLGNRLTSAALYDFADEMKEIFDYSWPSEVFRAINAYDGSD